MIDANSDNEESDLIPLMRKLNIDFKSPKFEFLGYIIKHGSIPVSKVSGLRAKHLIEMNAEGIIIGKKENRKLIYYITDLGRKIFEQISKTADNETKALEVRRIKRDFSKVRHFIKRYGLEDKNSSFVWVVVREINDFCNFYKNKNDNPEVVELYKKFLNELKKYMVIFSKLLNDDILNDNVIITKEAIDRYIKAISAHGLDVKLDKDAADIIAAKQ
jgi:hypothetical protein